MADMIEPNLVDARTFADGPPHALFDRLRDKDPCHYSWDPLLNARLWALTRYNDIRNVSMDKRRFTSTRGFIYPMRAEQGSRSDDNIMFNDGPRHDRIRGMLASAFTPRVVARFDHWIREICIRIIAEVKQAGSFDAVSLIAAQLPAQVVASVLGVPDQDRHKLILWANDVFSRMDPDIGFAGALAAREACEKYSLELRETKRGSPGADLATELLDAEGPGGAITDGEYQQSIFSIMLAGFETTHTLIAQSLLLMAREPEAMEQIYGAPDEAVPIIVEELLRIVSPVNMMCRSALEDMQIHGQHIEAGDWVCMWYSAGNRDPSIFVDPHRFDYRRGKVPHMAFGAGGPHFCLGAHLARLEVKILIDEMRKANLRLGLDGQPKRAVDVSINALRSLPMHVA